MGLTITMRDICRAYVEGAAQPGQTFMSAEEYWPIWIEQRGGIVGCKSEEARFEFAEAYARAALAAQPGRSEPPGAYNDGFKEGYRLGLKEGKRNKGEKQGEK